MNIIIRSRHRTQFNGALVKPNSMVLSRKAHQTFRLLEHGNSIKYLCRDMETNPKVMPEHGNTNQCGLSDCGNSIHIHTPLSQVDNQDYTIRCDS